MSDLLRHRSRHTVEMDTGKDWSEMIFDNIQWSDVLIFVFILICIVCFYLLLANMGGIWGVQ